MGYLLFAGTPGGPGTVLLKRGVSQRKLIIDNFEKTPDVYRPDSSSRELDIMTQGTSAA